MALKKIALTAAGLLASAGAFAYTGERYNITKGVTEISH